MNVDTKINTNYNKDFDEHLEYAYNLCSLNYTHDELKSMLKNGNIAEKQIAALKFDYVRSDDDAQTLLLNLTGCDGKIREAVAEKINSLIQNEPLSRLFFANTSSDKFAEATIDINANICRMIIDSALMLSEYQDFSAQYINKIIKFTNDALNELDKFIYKDKKYVINKQLFKLYWCLDAIGYFYNYVDAGVLEEILTRCSTQAEYTIREKTASILNNSELFPPIKQKLMKDENYYVREVFKSSTLL